MNDDTAQSINIAVDVSTAAGKAWASNGSRTSWYPTPYVDYSQGISERADVRYASIHPFGRTEAYKTFVGVNNREVTIRLNYVAGTGRVTTTSFSGPNNMTTYDVGSTIGDTVIKPALWLENLKYPVSGVSTGASYYPPPPVFLIIGSLLRMRAVVTECRVTWNGPWHTVSASAPSLASFTGLASPAPNLLPHMAEVTMTFTAVTSNPTGTMNPEDAYSGSHYGRPGIGYGF